MHGDTMAANICNIHKSDKKPDGTRVAKQYRKCKSKCPAEWMQPLIILMFNNPSKSPFTMEIRQRMPSIVFP